MPAKRKPETLETLLARPWCYYCDRDFDDEKNLVDHQKAKHFMCTVPSCRRRLNTVGGLTVHLQQVHKEELHDVPNALPERNNLKLEIFANYGIPEDIVRARTDYVLKQFHQIETEFYKKTGNPLPGSGRTHVSKKPKMEDKESLKARVAEAKAKLQAKKAAAAAGLPDPTQTSSPTPPAGQGSAPSPYPAPAPAAPVSVPPGMVPPGMATSPPPGMFFSPAPAGSPPGVAPFTAIPGFPMPAQPAPYGFPPQMTQGYNSYSNSPQPSLMPNPMHAFQAPNNGWQSSAPYGGVSFGFQSPAQPPPQSNTAVDNLINGVFESGGQIPAEYQAATTQKPVKQEPVKPVEKSPVAEPALASSKREQTEDPSTLEPTCARVVPEPAARAAKGERQLLTDNKVSWEEKRAQSGRYRVKPKPKDSQVPTQTATQGVSGAVDVQMSS